MSEKLSVEYKIISDNAIARLNNLYAKLQKVEAAAVKQQKAIGNAFKAAGKSMAVFGAISVGVLYSIIRASAYASMWYDQLTHTTSRLATTILEMTGLDKDIEGLLVIYENFVDLLEDKDITITIALLETGKKLGAWFLELDTWKQAVLVFIGIVGFLLIVWTAVAAGALLVGGWTAGVAAWTTTLVVAGTSITAIVLAIGLLVGAVLGLIVVWVLWKTGVLQAITDLGAKFGTWLQELGGKIATWLVEKGAAFGTWVVELGAKFGELVVDVIAAFAGLWDDLKTGAEEFKTDLFAVITAIIDKVKDLIKKILSIPSKASFGLGGGGDSGHASGGHVNVGGAAIVHQGEDIVNLRRIIGNTTNTSNNTSRNSSIVINPVINISSNNITDPFEQTKIADIVSKRMAAELSRISTSI